jgi:hypothetical protein
MAGRYLSTFDSTLAFGGAGAAPDAQGGGVFKAAGY